MKTSNATPVRLLCFLGRSNARSIVPPLHPQLIRSQSTSQTTTTSHDSALLDQLRSPPSGKKFKDLVADLNQRSELLKQIEKIKSLPKKKIEEQSQLTTSDQITTENAISSSRRRRTSYEEDPEFMFERKRGKRHVMIKLKQSGGSSLAVNERIELVEDLDISLRNPHLQRVVISLPKQWKKSKKFSISTTHHQPSPVTEQTSQVSKQDDPRGEARPVTSEAQETPDNSGINDFIEMYLSALVWSNPKVDITLTYGDVLTPTMSLATALEATGTKNEKTIDLSGLTRSQILKLLDF